VPEGIIFQTANAYKELRRLLIEDGLFAVVSLPAGVFNPYSGVKTSILFFDNNLAKRTDEVLFIKIMNDGYDLGAQRRARPDLPNDIFDKGGAVDVLNAQKIAIQTGNQNTLVQNNSLFTWLVKKEKIAESGDYSLLGERYKEKEEYKKQKWPMVELGEVLNYEQPTKYIVKSINYDDNFKIPVLTAGKTFVLGHTNEKEGVFPANKLPVIIFDDFTTAIKFVNFPFKVKSSAMKILHAKKDKADARFLFELMKTIKFRHEQHKRYWISEYSKIKIPLPPLKVQKEILQRIKNKQEIINDAKELIAKTERERANSGQIFERLDCEWVALEDVCSELFAGGDVPKDHSKAKNKEYPIPIYSNGVGDNSLYGFTKKARVNQPCITISARGTIGYPELREEPFYPAIRLIVAIPKSDIMNLKFLKYVLEIRNINRSGNTIPQLTVPTIKKEMIPIPSLEIQKQVAGLFEKQSEAVRANKQLIKVFDQQIQDEISEVWG